MTLHDPYILLLLPLALVCFRPRAALRFGPSGLAGLPDTWRVRAGRLLPVLRALTWGLLVLALARPQWEAQESQTRSLGRELMLAIDLSTSMLAEEVAQLRPRKNRLDAAKAVLADFLKGRLGDRIGLIVFAARAYPAAPLTLDHSWLGETIAGLEPGTIEDGTALGEAILAALSRLRAHPDKDRAVILLSDGRANVGEVPPETAAAAAKALGIRIHTIGLGSRGPAVIPVDDPLGGILYRPVELDLDEDTLQKVAATTGGHYFRADDDAMLARILAEIDQLEKSEIEVVSYSSYLELFPYLLLTALGLGLAELSLRATWLRGLH